MKAAFLCAIIYRCALEAPIGGWMASPGQFPHQVSLFYDNQFACGGSIIDQTTILSAGHCIDGKVASRMFVVTGSTKLNSGGDSYSVSKLILHEAYYPNELYNDISIIKLAQPIVYKPNVKAIALPTASIGDNDDVTVSGWGLTRYPGGDIPNDLQYIKLKTIDLNQCSTMTSLRPITSYQICTYTRVGQGTCHGDSGGPLIDNNGRLVGVVSWGQPCAVGEPDVFTRVYSYLDWIAANR